MRSILSGGNGAFVCTQYKVSETKSAAISYLNAAVTLQFLHPARKKLVVQREKKKQKLVFVMRRKTLFVGSPPGNFQKL